MECHLETADTGPVRPCPRHYSSPVPLPTRGFSGDPQLSITKDRSWLEAYRTLASLLEPNDLLLAPHASWPSFPCQVRLYQGPFEPGDATAVLLHKGRLPSLPKNKLAQLMEDWTCVFANDVFVALKAGASRVIRIPSLTQWRHLWPLQRYLNSRRLKRRRGTIYLLHIPKTGGTSFWSLLSRAYPSCVYYPDIESWTANPPAIGEYDLVGLHFPLSTVTPILRDEDIVISMLRDPTERFLSAIVHARRSNEDPETFTPAMQAMRRMSTLEFLKTEDGRQAARLQLVTLGSDHRLPFYNYTDGELHANAVKHVDQANFMFAPSALSDRFLGRLAVQLRFRPGTLRRENVSSAETYSQFSAEFRQAIPFIELENRAERRFYEVVYRRFLQ